MFFFSTPSLWTLSDLVLVLLIQWHNRKREKRFYCRYSGSLARLICQLQKEVLMNDQAMKAERWEDCTAVVSGWLQIILIILTPQSCSTGNSCLFPPVHFYIYITKSSFQLLGCFSVTLLFPVSVWSTRCHKIFNFLIFKDDLSFVSITTSAAFKEKLQQQI